jgi:hypothetical protein
MSDEEANSQPAESNPVLSRSNRLVGEWKTEVRIDGQMFRGGRETCNWTEDGAFLVRHSKTVDLSDAPTEWMCLLQFPTRESVIQFYSESGVSQARLDHHTDLELKNHSLKHKQII